MAEIYNLDSDQEFFTFSIFGHTYNFRYLTTEETDQFRKLAIKAKESPSESDDINAYLYQFIKPDKGSPAFEQTLKKMKSPHIKNFFRMIRTELSIDED